MIDWKPIETAPKGKIILGCWYDHDFVIMEMWFSDGEWRSMRGEYWCEPTHWEEITRPGGG